ncbi:uncharacterized protein LOC111264507 [Varroa jacobsoni]|uniref:uncharacterized protein LOC111264507 n=1 Tax=Varroa jacobsoni TaxID=62625 RepID=UPI000BF90576|nr:uncharacterized protein LOC111264507 [Varroa jacobsoni]
MKIKTYAYSVHSHTRWTFRSLAGGSCAIKYPSNKATNDTEQPAALETNERSSSKQQQQQQQEGEARSTVGPDTIFDKWRQGFVIPWHTNRRSRVAQWKRAGPITQSCRYHDHYNRILLSHQLDKMDVWWQRAKGSPVRAA